VTITFRVRVRVRVRVRTRVREELNFIIFFCQLRTPLIII